MIQVRMYYNNVMRQRQGFMSTSVLVGVLIHSLYYTHINVINAGFVALIRIDFVDSAYNFCATILAIMPAVRRKPAKIAGDCAKRQPTASWCER